MPACIFCLQNVLPLELLNILLYRTACTKTPLQIGVNMDKKIKKIEKKEKSVLKDTKNLLKMDKKQDKKMTAMKKKGC